MSGFAKLQQEDRRLAILLLLAESDAYSANEYLLRGALEGFGHNVGTDLLHTEFAWLEEQGLLRIRRSAAVTVAELTPRGLDVAKGNAQVPGVKRPEPGDK